MKRYLLTLSRLLLSIIFCTLSSLTVFSASSKEQEDALNAYHRACIQQLDSPIVLKMSDTLAMQAQRAGSGYYIVIAMQTKLDYYYFRNDKDKIQELVAETKRLAKEYNQPELYYFVWGSRLVMFYLKNGMTNHALIEAQSMLHEAQAEENQVGIIECYKALANIYTIQSSTALAVEYYRKLIDHVEKYDPDDVNIPIYYSMLSEREMSLGHLNESGEALEKIEYFFAKMDSVTPYQQLSLNISRLQLYIKQRDNVNTTKIYDRIERLFAQNNDLSIHIKTLSQARLSYYTATKQYDKALAIIDSLGQLRPNAEARIVLLSQKGDISHIRKDYATASKCYRDLIALTDSVRSVSAQNSANEIAGLMNVRQLENDKQQLQSDLQQRRLTTIYWVLALLGFILIIVAFSLIRLFRLNRQLQEAKSVVQLKNSELQEAKEKAEEFSNMKSRFIQDISHEVRTPLNAIVGFSQLISELCDQPGTKEYSSIITTNSDHLLRLFNDVLELSSIDQLDQLSYNVTTDIDGSCREAIDQAKLFVKPGVSLLFQPSGGNMQIRTNSTYVTRILGCLLHNAAKFTESGSITLGYAVSEAEGVIRYSVTDTGPGIPAEKQDLIFERFKKVDSFSQGLGLGLSVSFAIATKLGGNLELDKTYTFGCRFVLTLPLQTAEFFTE